MKTENLKKLIQASVGLLPASWLSDIVLGVQSLAADGEKCILFDRNQRLEHIQWVPTIFEAIEKKQVLRFSYNPKYKGEIKELLFHPHYLKEYNQRWFVFGFSTDLNGNPKSYTNCLIDRIVGDVVVCQDVIYIPPKKKNFASNFKDIVGVTWPKNKKLIEISFATNDAVTHGRIMTKPIHARSQHEVEPYNTESGQRGLITIKVIPNDELDTLLMGYGAGIEIVGPEEYRNHFMEKVKKLKDLYF